MNFFKEQDSARKKTGLLVVLLTLAVVSLIAVTISAIGIFLYFLQINSNSISAVEAQQNSLVEHLWIFGQSELALYVAAGVLAVVIAGMLFKYLQLQGGGKKVAESLGGRLLTHDSQDANEKKILNVVEEMAIASGNPVPSVYILEDESINAFAAGLTRRDAVIGITRGCINLLSRDELQGVVAHEFSHIHNGDMRLNLRLVAILNGILIIGLIGYFIMRGSAGRRGYSRSRSAKGHAAQLSLGLALVVIGYGGVFFGNIIKAAVSRQREFLADASAVQFTRNPDGIGNALKKIGGYSLGSQLANKHASEFSHLYFGQGIKTAFNALMATHPPIHERIRRVFPNWNGSYINPEAEYSSRASASAANTQAVSGFAASAKASSSFNQAAINSIGNPDEGHLSEAEIILQKMPQNLRDAAHNPFSARALVYALLLDKSESIRAGQIERLSDQAHPATFRVMEQLYPYVFQLPRGLQLSLLELTIPSLKQLSEPQYQVFKRNLVELIRADNKVNLFEWCLYRIVIHNVEAHNIKAHRDLKSLHKETSLLFSLIVYAGKSRSPGGAFQKGVEKLGFKNVRFALNDTFTLTEIDNALDRLAELKLLQKPKLLKAIAEIIIADGEITPAEAELYRAVADTLDCPVPPIVPA